MHHGKRWEMPKVQDRAVIGGRREAQVVGRLAAHDIVLDWPSRDIPLLRWARGRPHLVTDGAGVVLQGVRETARRQTQCREPSTTCHERLGVISAVCAYRS